MSDAGRAYVEKHSPYTGAFFLIHLRLGNIENDTYNHRLFIGDENLAKLCRCSVKTVQRAKAQMIEDGFLRLLKPATGRKVAEYEFLFPETKTKVEVAPVKEDAEIGGQIDQPLEVFDDGIGGHFVRIGGHFVRIGGHFVPENEVSPIYRNKEEIEGTESSSLNPSGLSNSSPKPKPYETEFDELWALYPRRVGKAKAYTKLVALLRSGIPLSEIKIATTNYARLRQGQDSNYTLHAATFWGPGERWRDYLPDGEAIAESEENVPSKQSKGMNAIQAFLNRGGH